MLIINNDKTIYSDDLLEVIDYSMQEMLSIKQKFCEDKLINRGLFLMTTTYFEASIRDLLTIILSSAPSLLEKNEFTVYKNDLNNRRDESILNTIIQNELFHLFKGSTRNQLLYLTELITNVKQNNILNKPKWRYLKKSIDKISDVSFYRNALIHDTGRKPKNFDDFIVFFSSINPFTSNYSRDRLIEFLDSYVSYYEIIKDKIQCNVHYQKKTRLNLVMNFWNATMTSPLLSFDDYWEYDINRDVVTGVKYPEYESGLSSSEAIYLSIWRH